MKIFLTRFLVVSLLIPSLYSMSASADVENRKNRQEARQDNRQERREVRQGNRKDRREDRKENRKDRRKARKTK